MIVQRGGTVLCQRQAPPLLQLLRPSFTPRFASPLEAGASRGALRQADSRGRREAPRHGPTPTVQGPAKNARSDTNGEPRWPSIVRCGGHSSARASRHAGTWSLPPASPAWTRNAPSSVRSSPSRVDSYDTLGRRTCTAGECSVVCSSTQQRYQPVTTTSLSATVAGAIPGSRAPGRTAPRAVDERDGRPSGGKTMPGAPDPRGSTGGWIQSSNCDRRRTLLPSPNTSAP